MCVCAPSGEQEHLFAHPHVLLGVVSMKVGMFSGLPLGEIFVTLRSSKTSSTWFDQSQPRHGPNRHTVLASSTLCCSFGDWSETWAGAWA